jgi:hypothetical protein
MLGDDGEVRDKLHLMLLVAGNDRYNIIRDLMLMDLLGKLRRSTKGYCSNEYELRR